MWIYNISSHQKDEDSEHSTIIIEEFEPDVFRQIIEYIHTSCVTLQPRTLLGARLFYPNLQKIKLSQYIFKGVLNASDYYSLDELKQACFGFFEVILHMT